MKPGEALPHASVQQKTQGQNPEVVGRSMAAQSRAGQVLSFGKEHCDSCGQQEAHVLLRMLRDISLL